MKNDLRTKIFFLVNFRQLEKLMSKSYSLESKKISNDQEPIQSDPTSKPKGK